MSVAIIAFAMTNPETFALADGCVQTDTSHITCTQYAPKRVSGGGKWFGPTVRTTVESRSGGLQIRVGRLPLAWVHNCDGDESSPVLLVIPLVVENGEEASRHAVDGASQRQRELGSMLYSG